MTKLSLKETENIKYKIGHTYIGVNNLFQALAKSGKACFMDISETSIL